MVGEKEQWPQLGRAHSIAVVASVMGKQKKRHRRRTGPGKTRYSAPPGTENVFLISKYTITNKPMPDRNFEKLPEDVQKRIQELYTDRKNKRVLPTWARGSGVRGWRGLRRVGRFGSGFARGFALDRQGPQQLGRFCDRSRSLLV